MSRVFTGLCLAFLALGTARAQDPAEHRLSPAQVRVGETTAYLVTHPPTNSVERLSLTTVHPPAAEGVELVGSWTEVRSTAGQWVREDGFRLRPHTSGRLELKPAVVEAEGVLGVAQDLVLEVSDPVEAGPPQGWLLGLLGACLVLPAAWLWQRPPSEEAAFEDPAGVAEAVAVDPLAGCREAKLRGDARGFYVSLYAALRGEVRAATGRSPRDPAGLARTVRDAGVSEQTSEDLRDLAARCERVVFGGEAADVAGIPAALERSEGILAALGADPQDPKEIAS